MSKAPQSVRRGVSLLAWAVCFSVLASVASASYLDDIGVTALRNVDPTLTGSGIAVIQAEADYVGIRTLSSRSRARSICRPASLRISAARA